MSESQEPPPAGTPDEPDPQVDLGIEPQFPGQEPRNFTMTAEEGTSGLLSGSR